MAAGREEGTFSVSVVVSEGVVDGTDGVSSLLYAIAY